jgi:membrane-associated phospholipid phosphatase
MFGSVTASSPNLPHADIHERDKNRTSCSFNLPLRCPRIDLAAATLFPGHGAFMEFPSSLSEKSSPPVSPILTSYWGPVCLLLAVPFALPFDITVSRLSQDFPSLPALMELLNRAEPFGHFFGAAIVLVAIMLLDQTKSRRIGWAIGACLGGGLLANVIKLLVLRSRPRVSDLVDGTVWDTFGGWIQRSTSSSLQSFPSGHTATAVGLAVILCAWYPRGRALFITVACLVGLHRIVHLAHFPSDVLAGAAAGWLVAAWCIRRDQRQLHMATQLTASPDHERCEGPVELCNPSPMNLAAIQDAVTVG